MLPIPGLKTAKTLDLIFPTHCSRSPTRGANKHGFCWGALGHDWHFASVRCDAPWVAIRGSGHRALSLSRSRLSGLRVKSPTKPMLSRQLDREGTLLPAPHFVRVI